MFGDTSLQHVAAVGLKWPQCTSRTSKLFALDRVFSLPD
jgi:hypothetical protein